MAGPLDDAWWKVKRAKAQIDELRREIIEAIGGNETAIPVCRKYEPELKAVVYRIESVPKLPRAREWGGLVGEIIHNLRCSLDYLWWQLAIVQLGREPCEQEARSIQFPIFTKPSYAADPSLWDNHHFLKYVSQGARIKAQRIQPYKRSDPSATALGVLVELSNADKHRVMNIALIGGLDQVLVKGASASNYIDCLPATMNHGGERGAIFAPPSIPPQVGEVILTRFVEPTGPNPDVNLDPFLIARVGITERRIQLPNSLDDVAGQVVDILRAFQPLTKRV